jgi:two-component system phosphate regulon response regulator PhoB
MSVLLQDGFFEGRRGVYERHTFVRQHSVAYSSSLHAAVKHFRCNCDAMEGAVSTGLKEDGAMAPERLVSAEIEPLVMLVENDSDPERGLRIRLAQAGFRVISVNCQQNLCDAVDREHPHLVIVDWDLPGMLTMDLVRHLRTDSIVEGPCLIALSRFGGEQHVIASFELGVDDYIIKPFSEMEVVARVRAVLRPSLRNKLGSSHLQFGQLAMDTAQRRVTVKGHIIVLRHMEFILLEFLMQRPERAYSRELLLRQVWGVDSTAGLRTVDVTIQRIRRALALQGCGEYLQTVRGVGYRMSVCD